MALFDELVYPGNMLNVESVNGVYRVVGPSGEYIIEPKDLEDFYDICLLHTFVHHPHLLYEDDDDA